MPQYVLIFVINVHNRYLALFSCLLFSMSKSKILEWDANPHGSANLILWTIFPEKTL